MKTAQQELHLLAQQLSVLRARCAFNMDVAKIASESFAAAPEAEASELLAERRDSCLNRAVTLQITIQKVEDQLLQILEDSYDEVDLASMKATGDIQ